MATTWHTFITLYACSGQSSVEHLAAACALCSACSFVQSFALKRAEQSRQQQLLLCAAAHTHNRSRFERTRNGFSSLSHPEDKMTASMHARDDASELGGPVTDARNPFTLPSDEEVFRMRDDERLKRQHERELSRSQKVWEKGTRAGMVTNRKLSNLLRASGKGIVDGTTTLSEGTQAARGMTAQATAGIMKDRRQAQDKESMSEFIAKKREMFLVQMSLDTKREEIRKIEEKAHMKEEALKKSEQMLEEDALRFDTFLKENDKKAHEAIKRAERETKLKTDKVQEIKKLNQQIQMVQSDMSKHREALEDCIGYKAFLDMLTPHEWFKQQAAVKHDRQEARRTVRLAAKKRAWEDEKKRLIAEADEED
eukprot:17687-Heterococcus_DN1.PRE.3